MACQPTISADDEIKPEWAGAEPRMAEGARAADLSTDRTGMSWAGVPGARCWRVMRRPNRTATRQTIAGLQATGRLEAVDQGVVGLARATADLFDEAIADPEERAYARAAIGRLHLAVLQTLTGKQVEDADAGLSEVIAALSAPMADAPDH